MKSFSILSLFFLMGCTILPNGTSYFGEDRVFGKTFDNSFPILRRDAEYWEPSWELGIAVQPHKDGRIKGIRLKNPTLGNIRLSVWDAEMRTVIKDFNVDNRNPINENFIYCEIPITAGKIYYVTINVRQYYYYELPYYRPISLDNPDISFLYSVYEETPYQRFPQNNVTNIYHGLIDLDVDFKIN